MSPRTQPLHNAQSARHPPPRREAVAAVRQVLAPLALPRAVAVGIGLASSVAAGRRYLVLLCRSLAAAISASVAARWRAQVYSAMAFTFQMWEQAARDLPASSPRGACLHW
jgi:hypothetical protein